MEKKKSESRKGRDITTEIKDLTQPGNFIMVGIGASAGGIQPLQEMFKRIPPDSGMAYAVILHLSPTHKSNLAEILQHSASIPVTQVQDSVKVEPNHVYVIPPNKNLELQDGMIHLTDVDEIRNKRVPIDLFFRSLAEVYNNAAVAVLLSGTGADGTLGMQRIKEHGGLTIVQDPREAEQGQMPRSAINATVVDFVLPVTEIAVKLLSLRENAERIVLPPLDAPPPPEKSADSLRDVLALVRSRTGHDFSSYKRSTILRRIERRLQVNEIADIPSYVGFLREHAEEGPSLLRDLLISVTNFFRDHEAFEHLERDVVPRLFDGKNALDQVRVWVTGCATGEEAYSIAILLSEFAARLNEPPKLQVFATDIDEDAIARARNGLYPDTITNDVSPERLKRFFIKEGDHYRVKKDVREMVLFAPHNILRDPPFSKLDLITCRNLLIYLTREIQERVLEVFHFALREDGFLFLGSSESAEGRPALFTPSDKKHRIYRRRASESGFSPFPTLPQMGKWEIKLPQLATTQPARSLSFADLHQHWLLERHTPSSVLVNENYDILHISGQAGRYLRFAEGEPSRNLMKVVHPSLRQELRAALFAAKQNGSNSESRYVRTEMDGEPLSINLNVEPVGDPEVTLGLTMITFIEVKESAPVIAEPLSQARGDGDGLDMVVRQLEDELQKTRDQLRATIEQYETSVEELKASNEELQAINEELRSATEELETSREELQSVNEELTTVNNELKEKVDEVSRANSDLQNLMASTEIGTIFLDRALHIKRYTPRVQELFNIIPTDLHRPLDHLTHRLSYNGLAEDAEQVLRTLKTIEREISSADGRWFIVRLLPYRTLEDRIDGVVVTFIDITERREAEEALRKSEERLRAAMEIGTVGVIYFKTNGQITNTNRAFMEMSGYSRDDVERGRLRWDELTPPEWMPVTRKALDEFNSSGRISPYEKEYIRKDGTRWSALFAGARLYDGEGVEFVIDLTERHKVEAERERLLTELEEHRVTLEARVTERTAELERANLALNEEVSERRRAEAARNKITRQLVTALEDERRRISRELHDQLGQQLTTLKLHLETLLTENGPLNLIAESGKAAFRDQIQRAQKLVTNIDKDLDFLAWELRPTALDDLGLAAALGNFVHEWSTHFNVPAEFHATLNDQRLSIDIETMLYRIAQEALNNISKHARASQVEVMLERRGAQVVLIIADNGTGFDVNKALTASARRGMGLISMRERTAFVGGTFEIESEPGGGTTVYVRVPFIQADESESHE
ncbi:MAG: chemotaxis protein CheB [Blastocatellia bacterium]